MPFGLIVIPQWYINYNMGNLLEHGETLEKRPLKDMCMVVEDISLIGKATEISVELMSNKPNSVLFYIMFGSGSFNHIDISGLRMGFRVDLQPCDGSHDGFFGINQLFMYLQSSKYAEYVHDFTIFPAGFSDSTKDDLVKFMNTYISSLRNENLPITGNAVTVSNPGNKPNAPSPYTPSYVSFVVHQSDKGLGHDYDTLNYVMDSSAGPINYAERYVQARYKFLDFHDQLTHKGTYGFIYIGILYHNSPVVSKLSPLVTGHIVPSDNENSLVMAISRGTGDLGLPPNFDFRSKKGCNLHEGFISRYDMGCTFETEVYISTIKNAERTLNSINMQYNWSIACIHLFPGTMNTFRVSYSAKQSVLLDIVGVTDGRLQTHVTVPLMEPQRPPDHVYGHDDRLYSWMVTSDEGNWPDNDSAFIPPIIQANFAVISEASFSGGEIENIIKAMHTVALPGNSQLFIRDPVQQGTYLIAKVAFKQ